MPRRARHQFIVLAEDMRHYHFVRSWLRTRFSTSRVEVRPKLSPRGRGAGDQWVREHYPRELSARRSRRADANVWLVVVIDGDTVGSETRRSQLAAAAHERGVEPAIGPDERVLFVVPCRNIETWFAWAEGESVGETEDYKNRYRNAAPTEYGQRAAGRCHEGEATFPVSVREACKEVHRVAEAMESS